MTPSLLRPYTSTKQYFPKFWNYLDLLQKKKKYIYCLKVAEVTCQGLAETWLLLGKEAAARTGPPGQGPAEPKQDKQQLGASNGAQTQSWHARGQSKALLTQGRADSLGLSLNGTQGYGPRWGWLGPERPISALWALALSCKRRVIEQQQANISYHIFGESVEYGFHKSKITY